MGGEIAKNADLRFATDEERFALAYLRWLAGGEGARGSQPSPTHPKYALTWSAGERIRGDVEAMVRDAADSLRRRLPISEDMRRPVAALSRAYGPGCSGGESVKSIR